MNRTTDRDGRTIEVGSTIRLLSVESGLLDSLAPDERDQVTSMVGNEYVVQEVDEYGYAIVEQVWQTSPGESTSHAIAVAPAEMSLVRHAA